MTREIYKPRAYGDIITNFELDNRRCAIWAGMGLGKGEEDNEPVLTLSGWRRIADLRVGDYVVGSAGKAVRVIGVYPQGVKDVFRVEFNDGAHVITDASHLWYVETAKQRHAKRLGRVLSTASLLAAGCKDRYGNSKCFIPLVAPVDYPEADLPVEPYLLGVILGDGHVTRFGSVQITKDIELVSQWAGRIEPHSSPGIATLHIPAKAIGAGMKLLGLNGKRSWEKFVPELYLRASVPQRFALLQGLLDTDGYAMPDGGVEFSSTAEPMIDAVVELAQSLGGIGRKSAARVTKHQGGEGRPSWRVNVKLPAEFTPFRLARKLAAWVPPSKYQPARAIRSITPCGRASTTCIAVDAPDKLFVTRHHVLTHNTVTTLTALEVLLTIEDCGPVLVLAPLRVAQSTWPSEILKWQHLRHMRVSPIVGTESERRKAALRPADIYTINYDNLVWLVELFGDKWPFRTVIADESTRLKGFRLKQGRKRPAALARVAHTRIKRFIELTGTPSPNGLIDLWGQAWFIDAGARLGRTFTAFSERWFRNHPDGYGMVPLPHAQDEITAALSDVCLSIDAKDWFNLKDPIVNNIYVELPPGARKLYRQMERELFIQIDEHEIEAFNAAAKTQKLLQLASGAVYVDPITEHDAQPSALKGHKVVHDEKLDALEDVIEEAAGAPIMVAYHFRSDFERIMKRFKHARQLDKNPRTIVEWNEGKIPLLLAHPQSAGHGLNLQYGGNILVFFSHNWNLEDRLQIIERIGPVRQLQAGYDRPVFIHNIIARQTADEMVIERVQTKAEVQDLLKAAMKRT